jgi:hypothetical protein
MRVTAAALSLAACLIFSGMALADSFRCGSKLLTDGDSTAKVEALCGPPETIERREILGRPIHWFRGRPFYVSHDFVVIPVEYWTYNFGPSKLMRRLRFEDGLLVDVETLGHGYHAVPRDPAARDF